MNMPDISAVTDTARFATVVPSPSDPWMPGMTLRRVWANNQKVTTARTMPSSQLSPGAVAASSRVGLVAAVIAHLPVTVPRSTARRASR